jgi:hypothetical protein
VIALDRDFAMMRDYIVGRLSDDERRAFEDRLVRDPSLVSELEESLALSEGLQQVRARGYFARAASRGRGFLLWRPALAAAAVAALALFLWGQREQRETSVSPSVSPLLMVSLPQVAQDAPKQFRFDSMRGGSAADDLDLPSTGPIEILVAPNTRSADSRYRVTLTRYHGDTGEPVGSLAALAVGADGYLHCFVDAARLSAGSYVLEVAPDSATQGAGQQFQFNLLASGTHSSR